MSNDNQVFTFSTQERISDKEMYDFLLGGDFYNADRYYPPRYNYKELNNATYSATLHESSINFKAAIITSIFEENEYLSVIDFNKFITDYLIYGSAYLYTVRSKIGNILSLHHLMTYYMRVGKGDNFFFLRNASCDDLIEYKADEISVFSNYDSVQNIYGRPSYLSALNSITLNREATYFRIKYYRNGSHAGFILSINGIIGEDLMDNIKKRLQETKGDGNFRNLVINIPEGDNKSIQLVPISEVAAKDEFFNIKRVTDADINTAHRISPIMMGITPQNAGGFGDPAKHAKVFYRNEILPLETLLKGFNRTLGIPAFQFQKYEIPE